MLGLIPKVILHGEIETRFRSARVEGMIQRSRRYRLVNTAGLLVVSLLLSVLAAEGLWRLLQSRGHGPATVYDEVLGWRFKPDTRNRHTTEDFDVEVRIDGLGRRRGAAEPESAERPRVVFVGDSLTFGWGVEEEQSFPSRIGRMLAVEVVNLGVTGYGLGQSYLLLRQEGLAMQPAIVVLTVCQNDFQEVVSERMYGRTKPRFRIDGEQLVLSPAGDRASWLERASTLYRTIALLLGRSRPRLEGERLAEARRLVRALIGAMAEESRRAGARFLVVHDGDGWLGQTLDEDGVELVDVGPALDRAEEAAGPVTFANDRLHWNARGHQVVAEELRAAVAGWAGAPSPPGTVGAKRSGPPRSVLTPLAGAP